MSVSNFVKDTLERAIKTFAQSMLAYVGVTGTAFGDIDWLMALSVSGVSALASVLTSLVSMNIGDKGTASVVKE